MAVTVERICRIADLPHRQVLVTSMACLREIGVDVVPSIDAGEAVNHHHVVFAEPLVSRVVSGFMVGVRDDGVCLLLRRLCCVPVMSRS